MCIEHPADISKNFRGHLGRRRLPVNLDDLYAVAEGWPEVRRAVEAVLRKAAEETLGELFPEGDPEKAMAMAMAVTAPARLIQARAGSGKTTTLAALFGMLVSRFGVPSERILTLAFNRSAADDIGVAMSHRVPDRAVNARTFHSLAAQIVGRCGDLLVDHDDAMRGPRSDLVEQALERAAPERLARLFEAFGDRDRRDHAAAYAERRGAPLLTILGNPVKSRGEALIADWLFEHGLDYEYEPLFWTEEGRIYRPDFRLRVPGRSVVIEHWALDPDDPDATLPPHWTRSAKQYRDEIEWKRGFFAGREPLVEIAVPELRAGRAAFERALAERLTEVGLRPELLPREERLRRFAERRRRWVEKAVTQYVNRCRKKDWTPGELEARLLAEPSADPVVSLFEEICAGAYRAYEALKAERRLIDFDDLLAEATARLRETQGDCSIGVEGVRARDLAWIFVDEFQDQSTASADLVAALREVAPKARLVCVGDDWQAINGFAGADVGIFYRFAEPQPEGAVGALEAAVVSLATNRRSGPAIVALGNAIMRPTLAPWDAPARAAVDASQDEWVILYPGEDDPDEERYDESCLIEMAIPFAEPGEETWGIKNEKGFIVSVESISPHRFWLRDKIAALSGGRSRDNSDIVARIMKRVALEFLSSVRPGMRMMVLSRTRWFHGYPLDALAALLRDALKLEKDDPALSFRTAHGSKGLEAEVVVILDAIDDRYPLRHRDELLYDRLSSYRGERLDEERRLFYVACSRARTRLVLFSERGRETRFLPRNRFGDVIADWRDFTEADFRTDL